MNITNDDRWNQRYGVMYAGQWEFQIWEIRAAVEQSLWAIQRGVVMEIASLTRKIAAIPQGA